MAMADVGRQESEVRIPLLGDPFPQLEVQTTRGRMRLPEDFAGKWFVLFSHPADFTPVCTTEFVAFAKRYDEFRQQNCELVGLSVDQVFSHITWLEWIEEKLGVEIEFPVIADNPGQAASELGLIHPAMGSNAVRAVFVVDDRGIVRLLSYYPQEVGRNMDEILRAVTALQVASEHGVATPAGWPNNELIGDRVIVPPATDQETAQQRAETAESYEWWFVHREL